LGKMGALCESARFALCAARWAERGPWLTNGMFTAQAAGRGLIGNVPGKVRRGLEPLEDGLGGLRIEVFRQAGPEGLRGFEATWFRPAR